jgi:hypothetical protein
MITRVIRRKGVGIFCLEHIADQLVALFLFFFFVFFFPSSDVFRPTDPKRQRRQRERYLTLAGVSQ